MYNFGVGILKIVPAGANPTPVDVGILQDVAVDVDFTLKELRGAYQFPVDVARAGGKLSAKAKNASLTGALINAFLNGSTIATGMTLPAINEAAPIPTTPFTITVVNSATWVTDLGVYDVTAGIWLTRVASAPATKQYSVTAGAYLFAAADVAHVVWISYTYTSATIGKTVSFSNSLMGAGANFQLFVMNVYKGQATGFKFYAAQFPKLGLGFKNEDYTEQDLDISLFANASGQIVDAYLPE